MRDRRPPRPEWLPPRYQRRKRDGKWSTPSLRYLLTFWAVCGTTFATGIAIVVLGVAGVVSGFLFSFAGGLIVSGGVQLAADIRYIPRAVHAARHTEADRERQAP